MHTLDIALTRSESPPQKRSGMARVLNGFHSSFTCQLYGICVDYVNEVKDLGVVMDSALKFNAHIDRHSC